LGASEEGDRSDGGESARAKRDVSAEHCESIRCSLVTMSDEWGETPRRESAEIFTLFGYRPGRCLNFGKLCQSGEGRQLQRGKRLQPPILHRKKPATETRNPL
jgi:hypothetical protein